jgi:RHS repeat-associated protein
MRTYSDGSPAVTYTYHHSGELHTATNAADTVTRTYDLAGQLRKEESTRNATAVEYTYLLDGARETIRLNTALIATYEHYNDGLLKKIIRPATSVFEFTYDGAHRRNVLTYPNGVASDHDYDNHSRLTSLGITKALTPLSSWAYAYDDGGNRASKTAASYVENYAYDDVGRLRRATRPGVAFREYRYDPTGNWLGFQADQASLSFSYEPGSNRMTTATVGGSVRVAGSVDIPSDVSVNGAPAPLSAGNVFEATAPITTNRFTVVASAQNASQDQRTQEYHFTLGGTPATFLYDANGNMTQRIESGVTWTYVWNAEGQLKWVCNTTTPCSEASSVASFKYDALGRRVEKRIGSTVQGFTYDGEDILRWVRSPNSTWIFTHGPGIDEPLARVNEDGTWRFFHADGLGSIVAVTNSTGVVTDAIDYDPFGQILSGTPPRHAFTGREWDSETGLYYYRARYYDPKLGRFISEDPIGFLGGINFYSYALNDPVNLTDPFGLDVDVCHFDDAAFGLGHVGFGPAGQTTSGYYDAGGSPFGGPGEVLPDDQHKKKECTTISSPPEKDDCMRKCMEQRRQNPGTYHLTRRNCTGFVRDCLVQCGLPAGSYRGPDPKKFFQNLPRKQ